MAVAQAARLLRRETSMAKADTESKPAQNVGSKYRIRRDKMIEIELWIAFNPEDNRCDVLNQAQYDDLFNKEDSESTEKTEVEAIAEATAEVAAEVTDEIGGDTTDGHQFKKEDYVKESAKFITSNFKLDSLIAQESAQPTMAGLFHDPYTLRMGKIKYLLKEWTIDIPLKLVTLFSSEQIAPASIRAIEELPSKIVARFLEEYDAIAYE